MRGHPSSTTIPLELGPRPLSESAAAAGDSEGPGLRHRDLAPGTEGDNAHGSALSSPQSQDDSPPSLPPARRPGLPGRPLPLPRLLPPPAAAHRLGGAVFTRAVPSGSPGAERPSWRRRGAAGAAVPAPRALRPTSRAAARQLSLLRRCPGLAAKRVTGKFRRVKPAAAAGRGHRALREGWPRLRPRRPTRTSAMSSPPRRRLRLRPCRLLFLLPGFLLPLCGAFNLDVDSPAEYSGPEGSYFGFAVDFFVPSASS